MASNKNILDGTFLGVAAGVTTEVTVAAAVNDYVGGATEVPIGARIKSVYLFVQMISTTGTSNHDWYFMKRPGINSSVAPPTPGTIGGNKARKFVLHEEKGIPGNAGDGAYPLTFKGVIKIPKQYQRMGEDDDLMVIMRAVDISNACVKCIYRWVQ